MWTNGTDPHPLGLIKSSESVSESPVLQSTNFAGITENSKHPYSNMRYGDKITKHKQNFPKQLSGFIKKICILIPRTNTVQGVFVDVLKKN